MTAAATVRLSELCNLISEPVKLVPDRTRSILALSISPRVGWFASAADKRRTCGATRLHLNPATYCTESSVHTWTKPCSPMGMASAQRSYSCCV